MDQDSNGDVLLGFRVPTVVASPWTRTSQNYVADDTVFDPTSPWSQLAGPIPA